MPRRPNPNDPQYSGYGMEDFSYDLKEYEREVSRGDSDKICWSCRHSFTFYAEETFYHLGRKCTTCPHCGVAG